MNEFQKLVNEAVTTTRELRALESGRPKLTAKAFLRDAMNVANMSKERLSELEAALKQPAMAPMRGFFHRTIEYIRTHYCRPPNELRRLSFLGTPETESCMATVRSNYFEMFAVAVKQCADKYPECFGTLDNYGVYQERVTRLREKCTALNKRIAKECHGDDLDVRDAGRGMAIVSFAMTGGEIPLYPVTDAGERLVDWVLNHPEALKAA